MQNKDASFRKRNQIAKANRVMFAWVAVVSAIFGIALVASIFLTQKLLFNERVLQEKGNTISTLKSNLDNIDSLEDQIRVLDTNENLISAKASPDDKAVQVILDALPSEANSLALGASLQNKLLAGIDGLTIDALQVTPVSGVENLSNFGLVNDASGSDSSETGEITFSFAVSGGEAALKTALTNLEKSIRTIDITSLKIESQGATRVMTVHGRAFYEPTRVVELKEKTVE